jgi:superfamily II DNA or RNA helicase
MLVRTSGLILPKSHEQYDRAIVDLDRVIYGWDSQPEKMKFYQDLGNSILIPRFYPIKEDVIDNSKEGVDINIESNIVPRNDRQKKSIDFLLKNYSGILRLEPGSGKTVIAIDVMSKIKKKTIIFVHKDKLLEQWRDEITTHTSLEKDDISRLSTTTFVEDLKKPIILATIQAVLSGIRGKNSEKFIEEIQSCGIGLAFFDECHTTVGPEKFSQVSLILNCKKIHGLSATPTRGDGNEDIIYYHLGEVTYFPPEENELLIPKVYMIYFPFGIYQGKTIRYLKWAGKFQLARYYNLLRKSDDYLKTTGKIINKLYTQGRTILALGLRIESLVNIAESSNITKEEIGLFIPGSNEKQRLKVSDTDNLDEAFKKKRVVFSTYQACRDGNNRVDLDCLVMCNPTGNLEQAVGRVQRELLGKNRPLVVDLVDTQGPPVNSLDDPTKKVPWFIKSSQKRKKEYEKLGWKVEEITLKVQSSED